MRRNATDLMLQWCETDEAQEELSSWGHSHRGVHPRQAGCGPFQALPQTQDSFSWRCRDSLLKSILFSSSTYEWSLTTHPCLFWEIQAKFGWQRQQMPCLGPYSSAPWSTPPALYGHRETPLMSTIHNKYEVRLETCKTRPSSFILKATVMKIKR